MFKDLCVLLFVVCKQLHELILPFVFLLQLLQNLGQANNSGMENRKREVLEKRKYETVVIGDSYARGCVSELTHNLGNTFEVTGYVRLWNGLEVIMAMAKKEIDGVTKEDKERCK